MVRVLFRDLFFGSDSYILFNFTSGQASSTCIEFTAITKLYNSILNSLPATKVHSRTQPLRLTLKSLILAAWQFCKYKKKSKKAAKDENVGNIKQ